MGRRVALAVFGLTVSSFIAACAIQIMVYVFSPEEGAEAASCERGLAELAQGVRRARAAAAEEAQGERAALKIFRENLSGWNKRASVERLCQGDAAALAKLTTIDRLRYAEEHAVRYEAAGGVAALRRRVH